MVDVYGSTFGVAELGKISYSDLMRISAVPMNVGSAIGQFTAGALSSASVGTYSSTLKAQASGIANKEAESVLRKWAETNNQPAVTQALNVGDIEKAKQIADVTIPNQNQSISLFPLLLLGAVAVFMLK